MKSKSGTINLVWASDQHTIHPRTPTIHILSNLSEFFFKRVNLEKTDIIILGGDFFDRPVESSHPDLIQAMRWITRFLELCKKHNVVVIVLEGTSSHDFTQPEYFDILKPEGLDLRYVDTLSVVYVESLDLNIMCVPDNLGKKTHDEVWEMALLELSNKNLKEVDITAFHSAFKYQLRPPFNKNCHIEERWESITRFFIFCAHIHKPSERGKMRGSGSFDRLAHGEEHPKGAYLATINKTTGKATTEFYNNTKALPYLTINITPETSPVELYELFKKRIDIPYFPPYSQIRIMGGDNKVVAGFVEEMSLVHNQIGFTIENNSKGDDITDETMYDDTEYVATSIDKANIDDSLLSYMKEDIEKSPYSREELSTLLAEYL